MTEQRTLTERCADLAIDVGRDLLALRNVAQDALCDAAQFIDAVKQDAQREGWWTEWDQQMREKITKALLECERHRVNKGASTQTKGE